MRLAPPPPRRGCGASSKPCVTGSAISQPYRCHDCSWRGWRAIELPPQPARRTRPDDLRSGRPGTPVPAGDLDPARSEPLTLQAAIRCPRSAIRGPARRSAKREGGFRGGGCEGPRPTNKESVAPGSSGPGVDEGRSARAEAKSISSQPRRPGADRGPRTAEGGFRGIVEHGTRGDRGRRIWRPLCRARAPASGGEGHGRRPAQSPPFSNPCSIRWPPRRSRRRISPSRSDRCSAVSETWRLSWPR